MTIDTLRYAEALEAAKVPKAQARAHAKAIREHVVPDLVTTQEMQAAIDRAVLKMILAMIATNGALFALLKLTS